MYLVSAGGLIGGMTSVSATETGAALAPTTIFCGLEYRFPGEIFQCLPFAHIWMQLDGLAVAAMKGLVFVQHDLNGVFAGRNVFKATYGIAVCRGIDDRRLRRDATHRR